MLRILALPARDVPASRVEAAGAVATTNPQSGKPRKPVREHGPMHGHSPADLGGQVWEVMHLGLDAA